MCRRLRGGCIVHAKEYPEPKRRRFSDPTASEIEQQHGRSTFPVTLSVASTTFRGGTTRHSMSHASQRPDLFGNSMEDELEAADDEYTWTPLYGL